MIKTLKKYLKGDIIFIIFLSSIIILSFHKFIFNKIVGAPDWHYVMHYLHITKQTISKFHQFPHWVFGYYIFEYPNLSTFEFFAIPETPVLSPFIIFYFLDIYIGIKIIITLHLIIVL